MGKNTLRAILICPARWPKALKPKPPSPQVQSPRVQPKQEDPPPSPYLEVELPPPIQPQSSSPSPLASAHQACAERCRSPTRVLRRPATGHLRPSRHQPGTRERPWWLQPPSTGLVTECLCLLPWTAGPGPASYGELGGLGLDWALLGE
jgi:hypothetical protein